MKIYKDDRGEIIQILPDVLLITSVKGARRANHYHVSTSHRCFLTKGSVTYIERPVGSDETPTVRTVPSWEFFNTDPMMEHLMIFTEDSEMWCYSSGCRDQDEYENDLIRLEYNLDEV